MLPDNTAALKLPIKVLFAILLLGILAIPLKAPLSIGGILGLSDFSRVGIAMALFAFGFSTVVTRQTLKIQDFDFVIGAIIATCAVGPFGTIVGWLIFERSSRWREHKSIAGQLLATSPLIISAIILAVVCRSFSYDGIANSILLQHGGLGIKFWLPFVLWIFGIVFVTLRTLDTDAQDHWKANFMQMAILFGQIPFFMIVFAPVLERWQGLILPGGLMLLLTSVLSATKRESPEAGISHSMLINLGLFLLAMSVSTDRVVIAWIMYGIMSVPTMFAPVEGKRNLVGLLKLSTYVGYLLVLTALWRENSYIGLAALLATAQFEYVNGNRTHESRDTESEMPDRRPTIISVFLSIAMVLFAQPLYAFVARAVGELFLGTKN